MMKEIERNCFLEIGESSLQTSTFFISQELILENQYTQKNFFIQQKNQLEISWDNKGKKIFTAYPDDLSTYQHDDYRTILINLCHMVL